jgi:hypothetical protein
LLGAYIKKLDRAASKQQLAIDYEKWVFDIVTLNNAAIELRIWQPQ